MSYETAEEQRVRLSKQRESQYGELLICLECGLKFRKLGSHVVQVHGMTAREYKEKWGFDVKKGIITEDVRQIHSDRTLATMDRIKPNLEKGKKFWYKKGDRIAGKYERSEQTMERLHGMGDNMRLDPEVIETIRRIKARGYSNYAISKLTGVTSTTVKKYVENV